MSLHLERHIKINFHSNFIMFSLYSFDFIRREIFTEIQLICEVLPTHCIILEPSSICGFKHLISQRLDIHELLTYEIYYNTSPALPWWWSIFHCILLLSSSPRLPRDVQTRRVRLLLDGERRSHLIIELSKLVYWSSHCYAVMQLFHSSLQNMMPPVHTRWC